MQTTHRRLRGNGHRFLTSVEQRNFKKHCLEQLKLGMGRRVKVTVMPKKEPPPHRAAYLPLQHQLFGEQHGLVAERLRHLHPRGRVPGTAWTLDTCGTHTHTQDAKVRRAITTQQGGGGPQTKSYVHN